MTNEDMEHEEALENAFKSLVGAQYNEWKRVKARPGEFIRSYIFRKPLSQTSRQHIVPAIAMYDGPEGIRANPDEVSSALDTTGTKLTIRVRRKARPVPKTFTPRSLFGRSETGASA